MKTIDQKLKSIKIAYALWVVGCCGILGLHRFYLNKKRTGILWMLSLGLLGIGALIDLFMIPKFVNRNNAIIQLPRLEKDLEKLKELKNRFAKDHHFEAATWYKNKEKLLIEKIEQQKRYL